MEGKYHRADRSVIETVKETAVDVLRARFEARIYERPDGCWEWTGGRSKRGYGLVYVRSSRTYPTSYSIGFRAHRVAFELFVGPIPPGLDVCHRCDQPWCVNPAHLFLGSHQENMADREAKGRGVRPSRRRVA